MAWTAPKTWSAGETLTAANFNLHIRDNELAMGPHLIVRKTADETDSTLTLQNDDQLLMALATNEVWQFKFNLMVVSASTTDFQCRLTFPSGGISLLGWTANGGVSNIAELSATASPSGTWTVATQSSVSNQVILEGVISNGGSAGNLQLQWSASSAAAACVVKANSTLWAVKLA